MGMAKNVLRRISPASVLAGIPIGLVAHAFTSLLRVREHQSIAQAWWTEAQRLGPFVYWMAAGLLVGVLAGILAPKR